MNEPKNTKHLLLILPCYNEAGSLGALLQQIKTLDLNCDTVVVDDGSEDETYEVAKKLSPCLRLAVNLGIGGAVQTGIKYAKEHGYDFCIQVDGDGQHPPEQIHLLLDQYKKSPCNITIGSRFITESVFLSTRLRRFGIRIIRKMINMFYKCNISDPTSGMRLLDKQAIELFAEQYPLDFPEPISIAVALEQGLTIQETPVNMQKREYGESSIAGIKPLIYMLRVMGYLIVTRLGRKI